LRRKWGEREAARRTQRFAVKLPRVTHFPQSQAFPRGVVTLDSVTTPNCAVVAGAGIALRQSAPDLRRGKIVRRGLRQRKRRGLVVAIRRLVEEAQLMPPRQLQRGQGPLHVPELRVEYR